jgi:hypothetical protein
MDNETQDGYVWAMPVLGELFDHGHFDESSVVCTTAIVA